MTSPHVALPSVTGVEIALQIAGPGRRSYAFVADWHIRVLVALAWFIAASTALLGEVALSGINARNLLIIVAPAAAIYFLYHPILEVAMGGRTPGKRMAGVRIVTRTGDIPGTGAIILRNVFRLIDGLPVFYLVGLGMVMFTAQHLRIGDLAAGTLLIVDESEGDASFAQWSSTAATDLAPQAADLVHEVLDRWPTLTDDARAGIARSLIARLDREANPEELATLSSGQLEARLRALQAGNKP